MRSNTRKWKERIMALLMAAVLALTGMLPNMAIETVAAGATQEVTIKVVDSVNESIELTGVTIDLKKKEDQSSVSLNRNGSYTLEIGSIYEYTLSNKNGYQNAQGEFTVEENVSEKTLSMVMQDIQISTVATDLKVGEKTTANVQNAIDGAAYAWNVKDGNVVTISANGEVTANTEGSATIYASYNGKNSNEVTINVTKNNTEISLLANPNSGNDVKNITLTVGNLPDDATGSVQFQVNGEVKGQIDNIAITKEWTFQENMQEPFQGIYAIKAIYSGDDKYLGSDVTIITDGFTKSQSIVFTDQENSETNPRIINQDDIKEGKSEFQVSYNAEESVIGEGNAITYESTDSKILEVDNNGNVNVISTGSAGIQVTVAGSELYQKTSKTYYVYVQKNYELGTLKSEDKIAVQSYKRPYNGSIEVQIKAELNPEGLDLFLGDINKNEKIILEMKATVKGENAEKDGKNVGSYQEVTVSEITRITGKRNDASNSDIDLTGRLKNCIKVTEGTSLQAEVTILKRDVYLGTENFTCTYGVNIQETIKNAAGLVCEKKKELENTGIIENEKVDLSVIEATTDEKDIGVYEGQVKINLSFEENGALPYSNYNFIEDTQNLGTLKIEQATLSLGDILDNITFSAENGNLYQKSDENNEKLYELWINDGKLKATVNDSILNYYDEVIWETGNDSTKINLTTDGYDVSDETKTSLINGKIYLRKGKNTCKSVDYSFTVDKTEPDFQFGEWEEKTQVLNTWVGAITFNKYKNSYYSIEDVSSNDDKPLENSEIPEVSNSNNIIQSGVKEWKYHVYKVESDARLTAEALQEYVKGVEWLDSTQDGTIPVVTAESGELQAVQGNYIVLVKVTDNVGNSAVYSSNGVVIEIQQPVISIKAEDGTALSASEFYKDDVKYKVDLIDNPDKAITSGLASATIKVSGGKKPVEDQKKFSDSNKGYTLEDLTDLADKKTINGTIEKEQDSNNIKITVEAKDQAGNSYTKEQSLMIDSTDPIIKVKFDKNDVANDKYFKDERKMTITYQEKNFDKENGVFFTVASGDGIGEDDAVENVTLSQLANYGITYEWGKDSEEGNSVSEYTENRENVLELTFADESEYYIIPYCTDKAGNSTDKDDVKYEEGSVATTQFVIDKHDPIISVKYKDSKGNDINIEDKRYHQTQVTAEISIEEKYFWLGEKIFSEDPDQLDFSETSESQIGNNKKEMDPAAYEKVAKDNCSYHVTTAETRIDFKPDANYKFGFTYRDLAGREFQYEPRTFTVDATDPTGKIKIRGNIFTIFKNMISFGIFNKTKEDVTVSGDDFTAGVESMHYFVDKPGVEKKGEFNSLTKDELLNNKERWTQIEIPKEGKPEATFTLAEEGQYVIYTIIKDKAGNVTYINSNEGVIIDKTNPSEPQIMITTAEPAQGIYNGDVDFKINVIDPESNGTYAGLEKVECTILNQGTETQSFSYNDKLEDKTARVQSLERTETIIAEKNNSNYVTIQVYAKDYAGNDTIATKDLKIDTKEPEVEIDFDNNNPLNGKYYKDTRTATIKVKERNFDEDAVNLSITNTDGTMPAVSDWHISPEAGKTDEAINYRTVTFAADGDYTMSMSCTDLAGNTSNTVTENEFTIDKTVPRLNVSFDNNSVKNGKYYDAARTATITVDEHNFNGSDVNTAITSSTVTPGVHGWSNSGNSHSATVPFTADGDYSFTVNYTDLAGNPAQAYNVDEFTIDQTKPEVEIFDIEDKSANNGEVAPGVRYSDTNHDVNGVSITYSGAKHAEQEVDGARSAIPNGESIKMADFEHTPETDDVYTMVAKVTDLAGNSDEKAVTFSVNRFGSNFLFSEDTEKFLDDYYNNEEEELVVTEINVDTLTHRGITCGHDGDTEDFKEGTEYTVKESGTEVSWKSYEYTIKKNNFEKEGMYNITIDSVDRATNQVNNKIKEADIEFVIDKTAPTVVINGIEDKGQYRTSERDITIATADNMAMDRVELYVDDEKDPAESYNAKTIQREGGELPYTLNSSSDWQEVKAVAIDKAGNVADTSRPEDGDKEKWLSVLVTSNVFVQFYRNTPLVIGSVVGLAALIGIIFLILAKRRKQEESIEE